MTGKRVGCLYCFQTLDPRDVQEEHRTFVRCEQCGANHHSVCWDICQKCLVCGGKLVQSVDIPQPIPLKVSIRKRASFIKPSTIIYLQGDRTSEVPKSSIWRDWITHLGQLARAPQAKEKEQPTRARFALLQSLWQGEIKPYKWFWRLVGGLTVAVLASLVWNPTVELARQPPPVKTVSVVLVIVVFGLVVWSGWLVWRVFRSLGVRRILILLTVLYLSVVSIRVLTAEEEQPLGKSVLLQMQRVASESWETLTGFVRSLIEAPSTFRFAYTGRNPLLDVPGVEVSPTPIEGKIIEPPAYTTREELTPTQMPTPMQTHVPSEPGINKEIQVDSWVEVSGTAGKTLRARSGAGISYGIVTRFDEGTRLRVLEGPVEADGYVWWKVRADQNEGWCADQWLMPVR